MPKTTRKTPPKKRPGAPNKPEGTLYIYKPFGFPPPQAEQIEQAAADGGVSQAEIVRRAVTMYFAEAR